MEESRFDEDRMTVPVSLVVLESMVPPHQYEMNPARKGDLEVMWRDFGERAFARIR
jgi:hypothetical protein